MLRRPGRGGSAAPSPARPRSARLRRCWQGAEPAGRPARLRGGAAARPGPSREGLLSLEESVTPPAAQTCAFFFFFSCWLGLVMEAQAEIQAKHLPRVGGGVGGLRSGVSVARPYRRAGSPPPAPKPLQRTPSPPLALRCRGTNAAPGALVEKSSFQH